MSGVRSVDQGLLRVYARWAGWEYGRALEGVRQARFPWQASVGERIEAEFTWLVNRALGRSRVRSVWGHRNAFGVGVVLGIDAERRRWL